MIFLLLALSSINVFIVSALQGEVLYLFFILCGTMYYMY